MIWSKEKTRYIAFLFGVYVVLMLPYVAYDLMV